MKPPKTIPVEPEHLEFDSSNPRLVDADEPPPKTEKEMVGWLWRHADVSELVASIAQSGWMPFDDMVVVKRDKKPNKWLVLEGNRRLAALKLFTKDGWAADLGIKLPAISEENRNTFKKIEVKEVENREAARAFIGFKHVNGPHKWDAFAKAKFATEWLDSAGDLDQIALTLGDNNNTVRRLVIGYRVLEQAKANGFRPENAASARGFAFSHLYTALGQVGYQGYLGIDYNAEAILGNRAPVLADKVENLLRLLTWLYGNKSEKVEPVIQSQSPDLQKLDEILLSEKGLKALTGGLPFSVAHEASVGDERLFKLALQQATLSLQKAHVILANGNLDEDADVVAMATQIGRLASGLLKPEPANRLGTTAAVLTTPQDLNSRGGIHRR